MKIGVAIEGDLRALMGQSIDVLAIAVSDAVNRASTGLRDELRQQVARAGLGAALAKAWQVKLYPSRRASMGASGWVYSKATRIHAAFAGARTISALGGRYLVIPLAGAVARGWDREGAEAGGFGRPRKWSAFDRILKEQRVARIRLSRGRILIGLRGARGQVEPVFLLVRSVRLKGGLDLAGPPVRWRDRLFADLAQQFGG